MVRTRSVDIDSKPPVVGIRHLQCFLLFWGIALSYAMRVNLSLAIVAMTDKKSTNQNFAQYEWSGKTKSLLLSSFFWGYIITQIPGGHLARKFGGKVLFLFATFLCSILALVTPLAADTGGWPLFLGIRIIQGLAQGVLFPTTHTLLSKWAPQKERGVLGTCCYSGAEFGTVLMLSVSGFIAASPLGWPSIFYISGGCGLVWVCAWYYWGASSPSEYKSISVAEKEYIESSITNEHNTKISVPSKTPWMQFFKSPTFISLIIAQCSFSWGFWTLLTEIPTYLKNIMGFNIQKNALLASLPYFAMLVLGFVFTAMASFMDKRKWLNITQSRKVFNTISSWIPAVALIWLGFIDSTQTVLAVILLVIAVGFISAMHMGFQINHIDLSPNFAGILCGISNTFAVVMIIFAPLTVGLIVTNETNVFQWRMVFIIAAAIGFFGNLSFIICGSGDVQPFNNINLEPDLKTEIEMSAVESVEKEKS